MIRNLMARLMTQPYLHVVSRRSIKFLSLIGLIGLAGCNYPTGGTHVQPGPVSDLQLTLAAMDGEIPPSSVPTETATEQRINGNADPFAGLHTPTPAAPDRVMVHPMPTVGPLPSLFNYTVLSGDTLPAVAARFEVEPEDIVSDVPLPAIGYLQPGSTLQVPNRLEGYAYPDALIPDSEVIYAPSVVDFDILNYIERAAGYLAGYSELIDGHPFSGAEIVERVAEERSSNPRLLLAFLEYRSHWVYGLPTDPEQIRYPIGFNVPGYSGLYDELTLAANHLNIGYYSWRTGELNRLRFKDGGSTRLSPALNAGTVALFNIFAKFYDQTGWETTLFGENNFQDLYQQMFGDPWQRASAIEPLLHPGLRQPQLELPFSAGESWSFTGGPHRTLNLGSPLGALDFSPVTGQPACAVSRAWVTAPAAGSVIRDGDGVLVLDLDGDGSESTGWVLFFLHLAEQDRAPVGTILAKDEPIGHPSCEGGSATGTHVHIARKYNGEWIAADGPLPFDLSDWVVRSGERAYEGELSKDGSIVSANPGGSQSSTISR